MAMEFRKIYAPAAAGTILAAGLALAGCSSAPIKLECQEIRTRLAYENMSEDQIRFAKDELAECEDRVRQAQARDSALVDSAHDKLTPKEEP